jgi:hypothetical protein
VANARASGRKEEVRRLKEALQNAGMTYNVQRMIVISPIVANARASGGKEEVRHLKEALQNAGMTYNAQRMIPASSSILLGVKSQHRHLLEGKETLQNAGMAHFHPPKRYKKDDMRVAKAHIFTRLDHYKKTKNKGFLNRTVDCTKMKKKRQ